MWKNKLNLRLYFAMHYLSYAFLFISSNGNSWLDSFCWKPYIWQEILNFVIVLFVIVSIRRYIVFVSLVFHLFKCMPSLWRIYIDIDNFCHFYLIYLADIFKVHLYICTFAKSITVSTLLFLKRNRRLNSFIFSIDVYNLYWLFDPIKSFLIPSETYWFLEFILMSQLRIWWWEIW